MTSVAEGLLFAKATSAVVVALAGFDLDWIWTLLSRDCLVSMVSGIECYLSLVAKF
jgi:hypothetical protein